MDRPPHEHDYVLSRFEQLGVYLSNNCRPDGREFLELQQIAITSDSHSSCFGSAMVKWGNTLVSCNVTVQVGTPDPQLPTHGAMVFDVILWSDASSQDKHRNKKSCDELFIESTLTRLYNRTDTVDVTQLCIETGKSALCLHVEILCLSREGSLLETCILSVSGALANTILPAVFIDSDLKIRITSPSQTRKELACVNDDKAASSSKSQNASSEKWCRHSRRLEVKRHFIGLSGMIIPDKNGNDDYTILLDPSIQEIEASKDLLRLASHPVSLMFLVIDNMGNICLTSSENCSVRNALLYEMCDSCSRTAQSNILPILLDALNK